MATRFKALSTAALGITLSAVAQPVSAQTSTVFDPVGDTKLNAPAFQDIVRAQVTRTAGLERFKFLCSRECSVRMPGTSSPRPSPPLQWRRGCPKDGRGGDSHSLATTFVELL